jgi:hypothetical protein
LRASEAKISNGRDEGDGREGRKEVALESSLILLATFWGADRKKEQDADRTRRQGEDLATDAENSC